MLKSFALASVFAAAIVVPAVAEDSCSEPIAPATINGAAATEKQLNEIGQDVKLFMKQSSDYQDCLIGGLKAQQAQAAHDKKQLDPSVTDAVQAKIDANQKVKEKVGMEFNTAALRFCQAHPKTGGCDKILNAPH